MVEYNIKQVIVLRTKYPDGKGGLKSVRAGKWAAQAAHACMKVFFDRMILVESPHSLYETNNIPGYEYEDISYPTPCMVIPVTPEMVAWSTGKFAKVVLGVDSEEDLLRAYELAKEANLPTALIQDVGNTEFHGVPTYTAVAIGPAKVELIDKITGKDGAVPTRLL